MNPQNAKIALVFDWTTCRGGAERVNILLHKMFPQAPIFTSVFNKENFPEFKDADIRTSFIQKLPFAKKKHQYYLNFMPYAYEQFDLSEFDIVISSSHACAKGIITKPETLHICYCHSPMRYAWDNWHSYFEEYKMNPLIKFIGKRRMHKIRMWDRLSAERVDYYIANSNTTKNRIHEYYSKPSSIIHPSIDWKNHSISKKTKGYFLAVGRLTPYKKFDLLVEAFNETGLQLKIVGTGISETELRSKAKENIEFTGFVSEKELKTLYSECEALVFPQLEDFGITPLEAMASGRPVIAYGRGGALDTVVDGETGILFEQQSAKSLQKALEKYMDNKKKFKPENIREHAKNFSNEEFSRQFKKYLRDKWKHFSEK